MNEREPGAFDVRVLPGGKHVLAAVPAQAAGVIGAEAIRLLREHGETKRGDLDARAHELWARIRERVYDEETGRRIEQALCVPEIPSPTYLLGRVLALLAEAGGLECALLLERARIDEQLAALYGESLGAHRAEV